MTHQVVVKNIAKTEFLLGLAAMLVNAIAAESLQHIQEKLAEIWVNLETMRAFLRAAEADAQLDEWGVMRPAWDPLDAARNLYPRLYPRMVEIIQQIGASGLVAMPSVEDMTGPLAEDIRKYYQAARAEAFERVPMFRLAWDVAVSAFGSRQVLYERFFFGDPVRMAGALVTGHNAQIQQYAEKRARLRARGSGRVAGMSELAVRAHHWAERWPSFHRVRPRLRIEQIPVDLDVADLHAGMTNAISTQ